MAIVQVGGSLRSVQQRPQALSPSYPSALSTAMPATYAALFRTQPSVRTVVTFLARNIADLNVHVYRRVSDTDRERLMDHELAVWLATPNPGITRYRMIENLMCDMGIYFNAYWLKVRDEQRLYFVRIPPETIVPDGWLLPSTFLWTLPDATVRALAPRDVVFYNGYDPCSPLMGLSPLETLRGILAEEATASAKGRAYNATAARVEGFIVRPKELKKYTREQAQEWREQWQLRYSGQPGQVALLQEGETFLPASHSPRESEFTEARKLTREEVARHYHIPLPMVGILDHSTFSNIKEQHKNLYQDALGPWLTMVSEEWKLQVLPECDDQVGIYTEFNIEQKMRGSFEEQAASFRTLVGTPVITVNEARGRLNLPRLDDPSADGVAKPLNLTLAGPGRGDEFAARAGVPAVSSAITDPLVDEARRRRAFQEWVDPATPDGMARQLAEDLTQVLRRNGLSAEVAMRAAEQIALEHAFERVDQP